MKYFPFELRLFGVTAVCLLTAASISFAQSASPAPGTAALPVVATSPVAAPSGQPNPADVMKQMMELAKTNDNHKLLASTTGNWTYTVKMWMNPDPTAKPMESKGMAVRKMALDGRYLTGDYIGKMMMPGMDGKMKEVTFHGMGVEAYDNVKQKFLATWMDNMGTGIEVSEGTYDPATKSFTYTAEMEPMPGFKQQVREVIKLTDNNHMLLEWYENTGGQERKTMEIDYTRAGKGK